MRWKEDVNEWELGRQANIKRWCFNEALILGTVKQLANLFSPYFIQVYAMQLK